MAGFQVDMSPLERSSRNVGQSLVDIGQNIADSRLRSQQDQEQGDVEAFMRQAMDGDPVAMKELMVKSPQAARMVAEHIQSQQAGQQAEQDRFTGEIANNTAGFIEQMHTAPQEQQEAMFNAAIDDPRYDIDEEDRGLYMDVNARKAIVGQVKGKDYAESFFGGGDGKGAVGTVSPKDFTVESMDRYQNSGDIKDLERYSPKTVEVAGVTHSLNPVTQKWEPIVDATSERLTNQAKAIATLEADKKSRVDFGKSKTKWQTGRPKFKSKIASSKASQKILEATSKQLKDNINNWSTKYGASLSSLPGSEARRLKNQLNTLKAHSAFSTLTDLKDSGGTLGAISEAELVLLESKLGALDQGGDATELVRVIDQIVNSNIDSIGRLETEFHNTNAMYSGSFDELDSAREVQTQESVETQEGARATNPETGQVAIFTNGKWAVQ